MRKRFGAAGAGRQCAPAALIGRSWPLRVTKGQDKLSLYQWNTRTARHYFCSVCGIYTHHQRRSLASIVACIEGVDPFGFGEAAGETP
jgi:hypothetical protein